jgi:REP element-mobilizing transposase RayT
LSSRIRLSADEFAPTKLFSPRNRETEGRRFFGTRCPSQAVAFWLEWGGSQAQAELVPWGTKTISRLRGTLASVTFCYHHRRSPTTSIPRQVSEAVLERVRRSFELYVYGYIVTPEHAHLLLSKPRQRTPAGAVQSLKQGMWRRWIAEAEYFWQFQCPQMSVNSFQKLRYIHRNSVKCGRRTGSRAAFASKRRVAHGRWKIECERAARERKKVAGRRCPSASRLQSSQKTARVGHPLIRAIYRVLTSTMQINRRQDRWAEFYLPGNIWHPWPPGSYEMSMESD